HIHQPPVHLVCGDPGEVAVQQVHQGGHLLGVHLQLHPQQLALHPVVAHHHDHDAAVLIHGQQLKPP
ncbi:Transcriptional regulator, partial [Dysosmobacter welbionis]